MNLVLLSKLCGFSGVELYILDRLVLYEKIRYSVILLFKLTGSSAGKQPELTNKMRLVKVIAYMTDIR